MPPSIILSTCFGPLGYILSLLTLPRFSCIPVDLVTAALSAMLFYDLHSPETTISKILCSTSGSEGTNSTKREHKNICEPNFNNFLMKLLGQMLRCLYLSEPAARLFLESLSMKCCSVFIELSFLLLPLAWCQTHPEEPLFSCHVKSFNHSWRSCDVTD